MKTVRSFIGAMATVGVARGRGGGGSVWFELVPSSGLLASAAVVSDWPSCGHWSLLEVFPVSSVVGMQRCM